jgi:DNA helicase-2/ATP-dependent DNA helicase PcrA
MSIEKLLSELNDSQRKAATHLENHALVLAGAGCGKTKTIVARAAFLIANGIPPHRIQILTFTRRSASEIISRVKAQLGNDHQGTGLKASTFHTWCTSIIRSSPSAFGFKNFTVIDRDDQLQLFKMLRGKKASKSFPTAAQICDLYSFTRNTRTPFDSNLKKNHPEYYSQKEAIIAVMQDYESRKRSRNYFDYDDILDIVAQGMYQYPQIRNWISSQYDHILVDEMQDTNPLQWALLEPLTQHVSLFCVGDDAQSIYGFRGADFKNVHSFKERLPDSTILKLEDNYRSTQEILDFSNWLLQQSTITYNKNLKAVRGNGLKPKLHTFINEWEEARWIADDLIKRRAAGSLWKSHMILVRSGFSARTIEGVFLSQEIPYKFIGGTKLLESAHVRDVLSVLRLIGNPQDEIAWMRYLTLWPTIGEVTAGKIVSKVLEHTDITSSISAIHEQGFGKSPLTSTLEELSKITSSVSLVIQKAVLLMKEVLSEKYKNQDWEKRQRDFVFIKKLAEKHSSILEFIEEYVLDPIFSSENQGIDDNDVVTIITIHSAKGTEREVCYVCNVSVGAYPPPFAINNLDDVEEERRVLYVALTRAKNELILTRKSYINWSAQKTVTLENSATAIQNKSVDEQVMAEKKIVESYFLNDIHDNILYEEAHGTHLSQLKELSFSESVKINFGIDFK